MAATGNTTNSNQGNTTLGDRASDLKDRAGEALQGGIDAVKAHPAATAAVIGGVAAAAAAYVNRDKIAETASTLRDKATSSTKSGTKKA